MQALWETSPVDVRRLQGSSSSFTSFLNALLHSTGKSQRLDDILVRTTIRDTIADGGVDAAVDSAVRGDHTGWLACPTAWQYKARPYAKVTDQDLRDEVNKPYAMELIQKG
jgi:hypothetical protein